MTELGTAQNTGDADTVSSAVDAAAGLFLAAVSIGALVWLVPYHTQPSDTVHDIAPGFIPNLSASVVLVLAGLLAVIGIRRRQEAVGRTSGQNIVFEIAVWTVIAMLIMFGLKAIGLLFIAPVVVCAGMIFARYRNWWVIALMSLLFPVLIDQAAWRIFTVDLP